jgi:hypothetical protein
MKAISYSLFGYNKARQDNCFDFNSYLRGLMISIRMNRLIMPEWVTVLNTDKTTYEAFKDLFDNCGIEVLVHKEADLCKAMLWRLKPVYEMEGGQWKYSHVICRDLDSPITWREAKCVQYWLNKGTAIHAITDSVSHNIPMLGGMIGINTAHWTTRMPKTWEELLGMDRNIDYKIKGSDQTFLNNCVYPQWARQGTDSITQHYLKGMPNTFLSDYHTEVPEYIELGLPADLMDSNSVCGHIGAAGAYMGALEKFLRKYEDRFEDLRKWEANYPKIFYWIECGSFA